MTKYCALCKEEIIGYHNRSVRCTKCQKHVRRLQKSAARTIKQPKNPRHVLAMSVKRKIVIRKIESGEINLDYFSLSDEDIDSLCAKLRLKEELKDWNESMLGDDYLTWMEIELKKTKNS